MGRRIKPLSNALASLANFIISLLRKGLVPHVRFTALEHQFFKGWDNFAKDLLRRKIIAKGVPCRVTNAPGVFVILQGIFENLSFATQSIANTGLEIC
jgi:hypothetical protein